MNSLGRGSRAVIRALLPETVPAETETARRRQLVEGIPRPDDAEAWLMLSVLGAGLPLSSEVRAARRLARQRGTAALLTSLSRARLRSGGGLRREVEVVAGAVLVDVQDTVTTRIGTGVQRVAREVALDWSKRDNVQLVGWTASRTALVRVDAERVRARLARGVFGKGSIVPWGGHFVLAETTTETARSARIQAIAEYSSASTSMIAYDAIPLTIAETTGPGMPGVFLKYLAAAARMHMVAAISEATAVEYRGWRRMLAAAGIPGPEVVTVPLAASVPTLDPQFEDAARARLLVDDLPLVLCVGSHEPRKNHLAVLQAAEILWRDGKHFSLAFVGGNSWNSEDFHATVARLKAAGRPVQVVTGMSDGELWWGYSLARLTVFPSLGEGFGLPVAESLYAGTPAVTSGFGSMAEIAAWGGCVAVDPRDDDSVAAGIRALLENDELHDRLAAEARALTPRGWAQYAEELWRAMVN